ncbi:NUDIX hydrolase [candidate division KSB1 bacterium]|nr:NUDIX hydrolase [candidate division KSB1 bacterium]
MSALDPMITAPLTHRVAVGAYIFCEQRLLLLRRANPPHTFAPPGGKLDPGEDPIAGLRREVAEETGLEIELFGAVNTWFGRMAPGKPLLLCINYLARSRTQAVRLSEEHTAFVWAGRAEIEAGTVSIRDDRGHGYALACVLQAFERDEHNSIGSGD